MGEFYLAWGESLYIKNSACLFVGRIQLQKPGFLRQKHSIRFVEDSANLCIQKEQGIAVMIHSIAGWSTLIEIAKRLVKMNPHRSNRQDQCAYLNTVGKSRKAKQLGKNVKLEVCLPWRKIKTPPKQARFVVDKSNLRSDIECTFVRGKGCEKRVRGFPWTRPITARFSRENSHRGKGQDQYAHLLINLASFI